MRCPSPAVHVCSPCCVSIPGRRCPVHIPAEHPGCLLRDEGIQAPFPAQGLYPVGIYLFLLPNRFHSQKVTPATANPMTIPKTPATNEDSLPEVGPPVALQSRKSIAISPISTRNSAKSAASMNAAIFKTESIWLISLPPADGRLCPYSAPLKSFLCARFCQNAHDFRVVLYDGPTEHR